MKKRLDPEIELLKLLNIEEPQKYELSINERYVGNMPYSFWGGLTRKFNKVRVCNDMEKDTFYIMKEVK